MSTPLTKEQKQQNLAAATAAATATAAAVTAHELKAPVYPVYAATDSEERTDYHLKKAEYDAILANLQTQHADAKMRMLHADYALNPHKGGKKSRKSHNSKKSRKSKKSRTTYKRSRR